MELCKNENTKKYKIVIKNTKTTTNNNNKNHCHIFATPKAPMCPFFFPFPILVLYDKYFEIEKANLILKYIGWASAMCSVLQWFHLCAILLAHIQESWILQSKKRLAGWLVLSDESKLQKESKRAFSSLSQVMIKLYIDTIFMGMGTLGGKQPLEAKEHKSRRFLALMEMKFPAFQQGQWAKMELMPPGSWRRSVKFDCPW